MISTNPTENKTDTTTNDSATYPMKKNQKSFIIMKERAIFSTYTVVLTIIVLVVYTVICFATYGTEGFPILLAIFLLLIVPALFYAPLSVSVSEKEICVHSLLKRHAIPMRRVVNVERFMPTMGALRIFASGGFMGYWGIFKEGDVGRYMAYYGKSSDCFMVRLDNGDKYVIGCKNPDAVIARIKSLT